MTEKEQQNVKVIAGHTESIENQIKDLYTFVGEMAAITEYEKMGIASINLNLVLNEIRKGLTGITQSVEVIKTTAQDLLQEYDKPQE